MIILKYPEHKIFINLSEGNYKENNYNKEQITKNFVKGLNDIIEIFDNFNKSYKETAENEVKINKIEDEIAFYTNLISFSSLVRKILENPLDKSQYEKFIELQNSLDWIYSGYDDSLEYTPTLNIEYERYLYSHNIKTENYNKIDNSKFERIIKEDIDFINFKSNNLLKYGQFLSAMANNTYCYLCLYYENLNKKYYFRFENLKQDVYNYSYFTLKNNPYLLKTDTELHNICINYSTSLEKLIEKWDIV